MKKLLTLFLSTLSILGMAQTSTSSDGDWDTGGNWSSGVPADDETATIAHDMTLDVDLNIDDGSYTVTTGSIIDESGASAYDIDVRGTGYFEVAGKVSIEGDFEVRNFGEFILRGCDTMIVEGDVDFRNDAVVTIESCAVLIITGDLNIRNDNETVIHGTVSVGGDLISRNDASIAGTGNLETAGEVDIRNSSSVFGSTSDCSPGPCEFGSGQGLPIVLSSFEAKEISANEVELTWECSSEINNDYFTLEYSLDGKNFYEIDQVKGAGNSNSKTQYRLISKIDFEDRIYFRLKQTDYDGSSKSFNPVSLNKSIYDLNAENCLSIYPNPSRGDNINIQVKKSSLGENKLQIMSNDGKIVWEISSFGLEGESLNYKVSTSAFKPGLYFIIYGNDSKLSRSKLIVL